MTQVRLIEFPNEELKLTFVGGGQYLVWNNAKKRFVDCNHWPITLANAIRRHRRQCFKGFFIRRGRLSFKGV